jgi:integrase
MARVTIRKRPLKDNRQSLLLDYAPPLRNPKTGKPKRFEILKVFIYTQPATLLERKHNKETLELVENLRAQRQLDIQNRAYGFISERNKSSNFVDYFREYAELKRKTESDNVSMALRYFTAFIGYDLTFYEVDEFLVNDYKNFLLSGPGISRRGRPIARNTAVSYFAKFRTVLKRAYKQRLLSFDLYNETDPIPLKETHREQLEMDEFQLMANTPAASTIVKKAAIFAGLTGLRFSDVNTLRWSEVRGKEGHYVLQFIQEKTEGAEILPISDQAVELLGARGEPDELVFTGLTYSRVRYYFPKWLADAGIKKNITFHSFRHTYATLQLESGTGIYTVSKMLGHKNIKTTQIYAKVKDKLKIEATKRLQLDMSWINEPEANDDDLLVAIELPGARAQSPYCLSCPGVSTLLSPAGQSKDASPAYGKG